MQHFRSPEDRLKDAEANARFWEKKWEQAEHRYKNAIKANKALMEELEEMEKLGVAKAKIHDDRWNL